MLNIYHFEVNLYIYSLEIYSLPIFVSFFQFLCVSFGFFVLVSYS